MATPTFGVTSISILPIANQHHRPIRDITATVDAALGDLATATYR